MIFRQIQFLLRRSKTTNDLLQLHSLILKTALDYESYFVSQFILFACSISINFARSVFDYLPITPPLFAWNTIIRAYTKTSTPLESVKLFSQLQIIGHKPDNFTYPLVLKACGHCSLIGHGRAMHSIICKLGFGADKYIGNTLLRMYAACGSIGLARQVFDEMTDRDVVSWSSMIAGYVSCNFPMDALKLFQQMKLTNVKPNSITLVSLLSACTRLLDISRGKSIHSYTFINGIGLDVSLGTALLEMYSKCGHIEKAFQVFNSMSEKNLQSWTVMISGLADHGRREDVISLFTQMEQAGLKPDSVSFSGILSASSHLGLVDEGRKYFDKMERIYGIKPTMEHYGCMVDLLGRAGLIEEAFKIIKDMPMKPNSIILRSFLGACRNHGRILHLDDNLRKPLLELEPDLGANYVLAANISSLSGCWNDAADIRVFMNQKGLKKVPGYSWV